LYETERYFSGVQGEPCTKPGVISHSFQAKVLVQFYVKNIKINCLKDGLTNQPLALFINAMKACPAMRIT